MSSFLIDAEWTEALRDVVVATQERRQVRRNRRRWWMRPMHFRRKEDGCRLLNDILAEEINDTITNFLRMKWEDFDILESAIAPHIYRMDTRLRKAITTRERLLITLRYLAKGDSLSSLQYLFRVSQASISAIIPEVCECLIAALQEYVKVPSTEREWLRISKRFEERWNFPHAIGAIDGKHIKIKCPPASGTEYYNYKGFYSIVLQIVVDADYNIIYANAGGQGGISDGGIFKSTSLYQKLENKLLNVPEPEILQVPYSVRVPYFLLADKAFAFTEYMIKPYGGTHSSDSYKRIFNKRESRARMTVENTFGIITNKFEVLRQGINLDVTMAQKIVLAPVYLHNFLRRRTPIQELMHSSGLSNHGLAEINNRDVNETSLIGLQPASTRTSNRLLQIRDYLAHYFKNNYVIS